jgi:O-antigen/teichoic acid export membrane protein
MTASNAFSRSLIQIRKNLVTAMSSTVLVGLIGLATLAINTRVLTLEEVGTLAAVQAYALLISGLLTLSTHLPLMRMGTQAVEDGRTGELHALVRLALLLDVFAGIAAAVVTALCAGPAGSLLGINPDIRFGLSLFAGAMLFSGLSSANGLLRLTDRFDALRTVEVSAALLLFVAVVILAFTDAALDAFMAAYAVVFGLTFLARYLIARRVLARKFPKAEPLVQLERARKREFAGFALTSSLSSTIDALRNNLDVVAASSLLGREAAGIYGVAKQASGAVRKFASFSSLVSFVEFSRMTARGELEERARLFRHVLKICGLIGLAAVAAAILVGRPALTYGFGASYAAGYGVLIILVVAAALQFQMNAISMHVQITHGGMPAMMCTLLGLLAFIASIVPLASVFGLDGISGASVIYFLVSILAGAWLIKRGARAR